MAIAFRGDQLVPPSFEYFHTIRGEPVGLGRPVAGSTFSCQAAMRVLPSGVNAAAGNAFARNASSSFSEAPTGTLEWKRWSGNCQALRIVGQNVDGILPGAGRLLLPHDDGVRAVP
jgi:hypothetical protein